MKHLQQTQRRHFGKRQSCARDAPGGTPGSAGGGACPRGSDVERSSRTLPRKRKKKARLAQVSRRLMEGLDSRLEPERARPGARQRIKNTMGDMKTIPPTDEYFWLHKQVMIQVRGQWRQGAGRSEGTKWSGSPPPPPPPPQIWKTREIWNATSGPVRPGLVLLGGRASFHSFQV